VKAEDTKTKHQHSARSCNSDIKNASAMKVVNRFRILLQEDMEMKCMNESAMILSAFGNRLRAGLV